MTGGELPPSSLSIGTRVTFPYGGGRRVGTISDVSLMPDGNGGTTLSYLVVVGSRQVFVQGDGVVPAGEGAVATEPDAGPPVRRRRGGGRRRR